MRTKLGQKIDYSTMRGQRICPKCNRRGEVVIYQNGGGRCFHAGCVGPIGLIEITDACEWSSTELYDPGRGEERT